ncbi:hypothetical protein [Moorena sp. SIO3I6]|uniref:hypothetical protein n=1 Tax=Moorena sp. SIO3I6 TaxID=2607831 RepID=UPI0013F94073|nr:hypothetical protein [Moorena sp. SIO3I6]NEP24957.1 hypothetical protein [Moorena sp. SIO3I6]
MRLTLAKRPRYANGHAGRDRFFNYSPLPIPDSRLPIPDSLIPTPYSLLKLPRIPHNSKPCPIVRMG